MNKHNLSFKKLKKQILSINDLIESFFNKLGTLKNDFRKGQILKNNKVFFGSATVVILTLSYFLIPTMYNQNIIKSEIKNQILKKYNINFEFNDDIKYGLLPKPHFATNNLSILRKKKEIGVVKKFKVFIGTNKLLSINRIDIKDLVFKDADFNVNKDDLLFFAELLKTEPNENKIILNNNDIFFKNEDDEILFINKIYNGKFFYDSYNLENTFSSKNEIFNIPYKATIKNDKFNKEIFTKLNFRKIRLDIENKISYEDKIKKKGIIDVLFVNKSTSLYYDLKKNSLYFESEDQKPIKGSIDFKPFYLSAYFDYDGLSTKNLFNNDSIFSEIIRSKFLNNKNLSANLNVSVKNITNVTELNDLFLSIAFEEGIMNLTDSSINWKDDLTILLSESFLSYDDEKINLIGEINLDFKNIDDFYKSFQIKKSFRKKIKKIQLDFIYNLDEKNISFYNPRIDDKANQELEKYVEEFNSYEKRKLNKIIFKNFVNNFFKTYAG